ncbi:hypothetical protein Hanom_Chr11g01011051 [Helianthus anomalus]
MREREYDEREISRERNDVRKRAQGRERRRNRQWGCVVRVRPAAAAVVLGGSRDTTAVTVVLNR